MRLLFLYYLILKDRLFVLENPIVFGVFSGHAIYFPELFPTQIRSTGVAFCNGAARIITSSDHPKRNAGRRPHDAIQMPPALRSQSGR